MSQRELIGVLQTPEDKKKTVMRTYCTVLYVLPAPVSVKMRNECDHHNVDPDDG